MTDLKKSLERVQAAYNPKTFESLAKTAVDGLSQYYQKAAGDKKVRTWNPPEKLLEKFEEIFKNLSGNDVASKTSNLVSHFLENSNNLHSPHYMGHQVPPPLPLSGIFDYLGSATNQPAGLYEMGPVAAVVEKMMIHEILKMIGWDTTQSSGVVTSGGSLANLTAILAARNHRYPHYWMSGSASLNGLQPAVVTSEESHYSVARAIGVLGLGAENIIKVPIDKNRRMIPESLVQKLKEARDKGLDVFAIVATTGTTPIGAYDPIDEISRIATENKIWLHIDGAHGASVLFSEKHRHLVKGLEKADSIIWDAHKMHHVPSLSTFVFYKNKQSGVNAFQQDAPYIHDANTQIAMEFDSISRTLECTKHAASLSFWAVWSIYGKEIFSDIIDLTFARTKEFYDMIQESADFEALHVPESNILCFRFKKEKFSKSSLSEGAFQKKLRDTLMHDGQFYTTATRLNGEYCLRVTIINPLTETTHLSGLLQRYRELAATLA